MNINLGYLKDMFVTYFMAIIYPFRIHDYIKHTIPLPEPVWSNPKKLNILEAVSISWMFEILKGIIKIFLIHITVLGLVTYQDQSYSFFRELSLGAGLSPHYFLLAGIVLNVILFPIYTFLFIEFWILTLRFMGGLFNVQGDKQKMAEDILATSQSSHAFVLVPVFGDFVQKMASFLFMYAGIRKQMQLSAFSSILILLTPVFLMLCIAFLFTLLIYILFF